MERQGTDLQLNSRVTCNKESLREKDKVNEEEALAHYLINH
ncbi:MAG TPA: hypothetical protein VE524_01560 [Nitrososphaeraceae archaeon]|nr:hypothetical protein [Nitrososphaeraceae archaeon]